MDMLLYIINFYDPINHLMNDEFKFGKCSHVIIFVVVVFG